MEGINLDSFRADKNHDTPEGTETMLAQGAESVREGPLVRIMAEGENSPQSRERFLVESIMKRQ